jgi:transposase
LQGKKEFKQRIYYNIDLDSLVPKDHFLKRLDSLVSFDFVRDITKDYYSSTGKPSIDPVVLVKMLLIGYIFDIRSERKLIEEISLNLAYRWYIEYDLDEEIPDHSIFSKARTRFGKKLFVDIFEKILIKCLELGLVSKEDMLVDSTIVKADASINSMIRVNLSPEDYWKKLDVYEKRPEKKRAGRGFTGKVDKDKMGKRRRDINRTSLRKKSTTDPDATLFYKAGVKGYLSYKAHIATDRNGIITAVAASSSVTHDISKVADLIESHERIVGRPAWIAADSKYGAQECLAYLQDKNIKTAIIYESKTNRPGHFIKEDFTYDRNRDLYTCPNGKILKRRARCNRSNRITYKSSVKDCRVCPIRDKCISGKADYRVTSHYDSPYYEKTKEWYFSKKGRYLQKLRHTILEGLMGEAKNYHGMARARFRGLAKVEMQFLMTASALNLKKMVNMWDKGFKKSPIFTLFLDLFQILIDIFKNLKLEFEFNMALATSPFLV